MQYVNTNKIQRDDTMHNLIRNDIAYVQMVTPIKKGIWNVITPHEAFICYGKKEISEDEFRKGKMT